MTQIVAGVDLGKNKAAVSVFVAEDLTAVTHVELPPTGARAGNLAVLADFVAQATIACDVVYIEEALVGRNVRQSLWIAQTVGAVLAALNAEAREIPVARWKAEVVQKGNATKEEVRDWLARHYPAYAEQCQGNQDRIDAVCIGLYGVRVERVARRLMEEL